MYTNIDTDHVLKVISKWLESIINQLPPDFPLPAVLDAMAIVMRNNLFEWGNKRFLQLLGTVIGTASAVIWANAYYSTQEKTSSYQSTRIVSYSSDVSLTICSEFGLKMRKNGSASKMT